MTPHPCPDAAPWYLHPTDGQPSNWWCRRTDSACTAADPATCGKGGGA